MYMMKKNIYIILVSWTLIVQILFNIDGPLYDLQGQFDSTWFNMGGKSLALGLKPYIDFADSKGILLWLIYAFGYVVDPYSYIGIYFVMNFVTFLTFLLGYRIARLYMNESKSLLATVSMTIPMFYWNFYIETKSEQFCWPFVMYGLYLLLLQLRNICDNNERRNYLLLGISIAACFFIKWSIAIMMLSFLISTILISTKKNLIHRISFVVLGMILVSAPFLLYLSAEGCLRAFCIEYFCNTLNSVKQPISETVTSYTLELFKYFTSRKFLYLVYVLPAAMLIERKRWFATSLPLLCMFFFLALSARHDLGHYTTVCSPFSIVLFIVIISKIKTKMHQNLYHICVTVLMVYITYGSHVYKCSALKKSESRDMCIALSNAIAKAYEKPKVNYIKIQNSIAMDRAIPSCKYWNTQTGRSEEMWNIQMNDIMQGHADIVFVKPGETNEEIKGILENAGYYYITSCGGLMYSKKHIQLPKDIKHLNPIDVIMKKHYLNIYK